MTDRRLHADPQTAIDRAYREQAETARTAARMGQGNGVNTFAALALPLVLVDPTTGKRWRFVADVSTDPNGELVLERNDSGSWTEIERF